MSIPKIIHYCWVGGGPLPELALRCIESWKRFCPDYEIRRWDETDFDASQNRYAQQALEAGKWAFVSDYARLKIVYDCGGIYLDTDVELLRPLDDLLEYKGFLGFQNRSEVATGLGFGAEAQNPVIGAMLHGYDGISFRQPDGSLDLLPCPKRNTEALLSLGLCSNGSRQLLDGVLILPPEVLCPIHPLTGKQDLTPAARSIHHFQGSWKPEPPAFERRLKKLLGNRLYYSGYGRLKKYYSLLRKHFS